MIEDGAAADRRGDDDGRRSARSTRRLIDWYSTTGEWRERAGGYAIQGAARRSCRAIDGDYLNVVGLPVATLLELAPDLLGC